MLSIFYTECHLHSDAGCLKSALYAECRNVKCRYAEYRYTMSFMLSVINKPFMLSVVKVSVIMLSVVAPHRRVPFVISDYF
jgi:hypothetical protein